MEFFKQMFDTFITEINSLLTSGFKLCVILIIFNDKNHIIDWTIWQHDQAVLRTDLNVGVPSLFVYLLQIARNILKYELQHVLRGGQNK